MKLYISLLLLLAFAGCTKDSTPTGPSAPAETPTQPPTHTWYYVDFTGYGESHDPMYRKSYSDGSWEKYGGVQTVSGQAYTTIDASDGTRYFYTLNTGQYAGYMQKGEDPTIFDAPVDLLPAQWRSDTTVVLISTFNYQGNRVSVKSSYILVDTGQITTPLGTFSAVAHFFVRAEIKASSGYSSSKTQEFWSARGPGGLEVKQQWGSPVYFTQGYVNGRSWGSVSRVQNAASGATTSIEPFVMEAMRW